MTRLLIDECLASQTLLALLRKGGYDVLAAPDVVGTGAKDTVVFELARREERTIVTADCKDFAALHSGNTDHYGLLLVYQDGDSRDMNFSMIVRAIDTAARVHTSEFKGKMIVLNHLR